MKRLLAALALTLTACNSEPLTPIRSILIIGDSVAHGYAASLVTLLGSEIAVSTPIDNCRNSWYTNQHVQDWFVTENLLYAKNVTPDVIIWNNGLWNAMAPVAPVYGRTDEQYASELKSTLQFLQSKHARLIFALTTDIPAAASRDGFIPGKEVQLNQIAQTALFGQVEFLPLHGVAQDMHINIADVHFTKQGYDTLAQAIKAYLKL